MVLEHIVVDGSNIATEGRSTPSLAQLETAVTELRREYPDAEVTVIVDATFAHRIDVSELPRFELGVLAGEYVHPPAGAIGRGDAFLLRVAEKVDATALSNDSFQEFHGEHPWLFERGRLIGGTPVPGVGWIFTPRTPVRGPTSRKAVKDTDRAKRQVSKAIEAATKEAVEPDAAPATKGDRDRGNTRRSERSKAASAPAPAAVNDPLTFISFIANHPLGTEVEGQVSTYTSHGAVVMMGTTQGYLPLANLADPPPRSAKEILKRGEHRVFVVKALDPLRRGVELALPGVAPVSGRPSEEMIAAEVRIARKRGPAKAAKAPKKAERGSKKAAKPAVKARVAKKAAKPTPAATLDEDGAPNVTPGQGATQVAAGDAGAAPAGASQAVPEHGVAPEQSAAPPEPPAVARVSKAAARRAPTAAKKAGRKVTGVSAAPAETGAEPARPGRAPSKKAPAKASRRGTVSGKVAAESAASPGTGSLVGGADGTPRRRRRAPG